MGTYELYKDSAGFYRFRLRSSKGSIIAVGEGFKRKADAEAAIAKVRKEAPRSPVEDCL